MKFDCTLFISDIKNTPTLAQQIEAMGFDALWVAEAAHNPYMALALASTTTQRLKMGTGISVAFARSPTVTAYEAWDLARLTDGRFMLGLGTQIKAHIKRRFGMVWDHPGPRMRDYLLALKALWNTFQSNEPLNYRGEFYQLTYMTPFFQPAPLEKPHIPLYIAAVGPYMTKLAGELCDGMHVHAFTSVKYMREVTLPNIEAGLAASGRSRADISLNSAVFVATNEAEKIEAKSQLAFYASTPVYKGVLEAHGWGDLQDRLTALTREGKWTELHKEISDDMLNTIGIIAAPDEVGHAVKERYEGLLDRVGLYLPFIPGQRDDFWKKTIAAFQ
jgi:probable F420-dependent oxidoreductase